MRIIDTNFIDLSNNYRHYLPLIDTIHEDFGGPSVHFHQRALQECKRNFLSEVHLELIYATLASWGMHRMGPTATKMVNFDKFRCSIIDLKSRLIHLSNWRLNDSSDDSENLYKELQDICFSLKVSTSNSKIVGNSKALAHILPDLVPPIDRQYTIRFFCRSLSNFKGEKEEREFFNHIIRRNYQLIQILKIDNNVRLDKTFNTSYPKIIDNLIMAYLKNSRNGT